MYHHGLFFKNIWTVGRNRNEDGHDWDGHGDDGDDREEDGDGDTGHLTFKNTQHSLLCSLRILSYNKSKKQNNKCNTEFLKRSSRGRNVAKGGSMSHIWSVLYLSRKIIWREKPIIFTCIKSVLCKMCVYHSIACTFDVWCIVWIWFFRQLFKTWFNSSWVTALQAYKLLRTNAQVTRVPHQDGKRAEILETPQRGRGEVGSFGGGV